MFRIAARNKHDTYRSTFVKLHLRAGKCTRICLLKQFHDITLETKHHRFSLWVTHAYIVLNDHRFTLNVYQAEEYKALI